MLIIKVMIVMSTIIAIMLTRKQIQLGIRMEAVRNAVLMIALAEQNEVDCA